MKIESITKIQNDSRLYDIQTGTGNFFANGILVHNSMIHTVRTTNGLRLKSKKSFESDVAKMAEEWMRSQPSLNVLKFCTYMQSLNKTAIFEWTAPDARIVLFYPEAELRLLHVRDNESGEYMRPEDLHKWADEFGVGLVDEVDEFFTEYTDALGHVRREFDVHRMMEAAKTREGVEGWVVQFEDGNMVKVKTDWYLKRHRAMTFLRERDIAVLVLEEGLDDLKSLLVSEGVDISEVLKIEERVLQFLRTMAHTVNTIVEDHKDLSRKDFAVKFKGHELFGLLMTKFTGKEPDFKGYFERNILKEQFTLRQLVLVPTAAEAE